jgi:hypothetical protein
MGRVTHHIPYNNSLALHLAALSTATAAVGAGLLNLDDRLLSRSSRPCPPSDFKQSPSKSLVLFSPPTPGPKEVVTRSFGSVDKMARICDGTWEGTSSSTAPLPGDDGDGHGMAVAEVRFFGVSRRDCWARQ